MYAICYHIYKNDQILSIIRACQSTTAVMCKELKCYRNAPKFSDGQVCANSVDPDQIVPEEQSDQDLHFLPFNLYYMYTTQSVLLLKVC